MFPSDVTFAENESHLDPVNPPVTGVLLLIGINPAGNNTKPS